MSSPNPKNQHNDTHPGQVPGDWSTGLCDCFSDVPNCCLTCWCPCITFGRVAEIADEGRTPCGAAGAVYVIIEVMTGFACFYSCCYRTKMRKHYNLPGNPCKDFLIHFFCEPCALCQEHREFKNRGFDMSTGWKENMENLARGGVAMAPVPNQGGMQR